MKSALGICDTNVATANIFCPEYEESLSIWLPFVVMVIKTMKKYYSFEITVSFGELNCV
jgi:hypothetical protein